MHQDPGLWGHSAGGYVLSGEKVDDAVARELSEEIFEGRKIDKKDLIEITRFINKDFPGNNEIQYVYGYYQYKNTTIHNEEVETCKWVDFTWLIEDIKNNPKQYTNSFKNTINAVLHYRSIIVISA